MSLVGVDKLIKLFGYFKANGGIRKSLYKLYRENDLKVGTLVGIDQFGNKYYENNEYFIGRNRWVVYPPSTGTEFEASMISPEWVGWIHHKTDTPPTVKLPVQYDYINKDPQPNPTGTPDAYMPYSTTKPKIHAWQPPSST